MSMSTPTLSRGCSPGSREFDRPTVLCIDDDPDITASIERILSAYDVAVQRDFCGAQGIWDAMNGKPDLIITDLRMPQGNGEDLLDCLKRNDQTRHIPVIVLTGQRGAHLPGQLKRRGADGFLLKPVHYTTLLAEIGEFIDLRDRDA
jgi:CheY-like chemotaxis protein